MAQKQLRKCSTSLAIRERQIKTSLKFHLTPVRLTKIQNSDDNRCWLGCVEREPLLHCCWCYKLIQQLWKSGWLFHRKMDILLPEGPVIPFLGIYPRDAPTYNKDTCTTMFIAALIIRARSWKKPRCLSVDEWTQKLWYI